MVMGGMALVGLAMCWWLVDVKGVRVSYRIRKFGRVHGPPGSLTEVTEDS
jgi:hypothetical protein